MTSGHTHYTGLVRFLTDPWIVNVPEFELKLFDRDHVLVLEGTLVIKFDEIGMEILGF